MANITQYTTEQKQEAAILYAITGSFTKVAKKLDFPWQTIQSWSKDYDKWDVIISDVQQAKAKQHRARYSKIVDMAQKQTIKEIPNASAAQANLIACQGTDKIRLLDNQPTTIRGEAGIGGLQALADQFLTMAERRLEQDNVLISKDNIIEGEEPS